MNVKTIVQSKIFLALIIGIIYFIALVPMQSLFSLLPGTEVRPCSFIPIVCGIAFGLPAVIGVFFGNLILDITTYNILDFSIIFGSLFNALSAYLSYKLWYCINKNGLRKNLYIYDIQSLLKYIGIVIYVSIIVSIGVSLSMQLFAEVKPMESIALLFLNNFEFSILLGIPILIIISKIKINTLYPKVKETTYLVKYISYALLLTPIVMFIFYVIMGQSLELTLLLLIIISIALIVSLFLLPSYEVKEQKDDELFKASIRIRLFMYFLFMSLVLAVFTSSVVYYIYSQFETSLFAIWNMTYIIGVITINIALILFIILLRRIDKRITTPLYNLAKQSYNEESVGDEINVLQSAVDFYLVNQDDSNLNNEYKLFIGLNDKNEYKQVIDIKDAYEIVANICLQHVNGYMASKAKGGWKNKDNISTNENTLVFSIFGAKDEQINSIADDVIQTLNQEAILIEKNGKNRRFYYGRQKDYK